MRFGNLALLLIGVLCIQKQAHSQTKIVGPYTHDNLSIFLIRSDGAHQAPAHVSNSGKASAIRYLTLQQAMEQKKVAVYEIKQVNELAIENTSAQPVFIQQGDIVKGGNQDRMITNDFILPPKSGRLSVAAFCVEQGRWSPRGNEPGKTFSAPTEVAAIRFAPKAMWSQASVWQGVSALQEALASHLKTTDGTGLGAVRSPASPSSLMLTQTSPSVEEAVGAYVKALAGNVSETTGVVGYAFAVNGEVKGADVYVSAELFSAMWPKLLKSSAIEAVRLREKGKTVAPVSLARGEAFLRDASGSKETLTAVGGRVTLAKRESERLLLVESRDGTNWVHRNVVRK
jgi:hypothetical protein